MLIAAATFTVNEVEGSRLLYSSCMGSKGGDANHYATQPEGVTQ